MRWLIVSLAVHAMIVWLLVRADRAPSDAHIVRTEPALERKLPADEPMIVEMIDMAAAGGGAVAGSQASSKATRTSSARAASVNGPRRSDVRSGLSIRNETDDADGNGNGNGNGTGNGNGIGFGNGGGVAIAGDVPPPPVPVIPPPSKARPAKLIWPNRDVEVVDESYLFVAKVTVDAEGSVVGARMVTTRPGSRGEHAANAIWQFRYSPALDDRGVPTRSTFDQQFQVR